MSMCKLALAGVQLRAENGEKLLLSPCVLPGPSEPAREAVQPWDQRSCGPRAFSPPWCVSSCPLTGSSLCMASRASLLVQPLFAFLFVPAGAACTAVIQSCSCCSPAEAASSPCSATERVSVSPALARLGLCWGWMRWLHGSLYRFDLLHIWLLLLQW